jgi:O-antigen ligase
VFNDGQQIRAFGFFGDQVGFVLGYFLLRCFIYKKWFILLVYAIAILLTGTRGAVISVSFGILLAVFQSVSDKNSRNRLLGSIASIIILTSIIATILLSTAYGQNAVDRFVNIFQGEDVLYQRRVAIQLGLQIYSDNPILGVGYLGFNRLSQTYNFGQNFAVDSDINRGTFTTQNQYVQAATDAGTFGLIALIIFLYYLLREIKRQQYKVSPKYSRDMIVAFSWAGAMIFGNQAAVWILPTNITGYLFFLIMGLSLILPKLKIYSRSSTVLGGNSYRDKLYVQP